MQLPSLWSLRHGCLFLPQAREWLRQNIKHQVWFRQEVRPAREDGKKDFLQTCLIFSKIYDVITRLSQGNVLRGIDNGFIAPARL